MAASLSVGQQRGAGVSQYYGLGEVALLAWRRRTHHAVMSALSDGFLATVLVLADRAGIVVEQPYRLSGDTTEGRDVQAGPSGASAIDSDSWEAGVRGQARELAGFMPR